VVTRYEAAGSYVRNVVYLAVSDTQLAALATISTHCEQFIKYECHHSLFLTNGIGWWVPRENIKMTYWGRASPSNSNKCMWRDEFMCTQ